MFLKTFEARNRHYSNRILIHIWSALPSLTVWSEFASDWQLPPLNEQPIGTLSLWNDLWLAKVSRHGLDFLKPENRAMRRCRSLVFSQNTWITICWKVIMEFFANDAKNILPTAGLISGPCSLHSMKWLEISTSPALQRTYCRMVIDM